MGHVTPEAQLGGPIALVENGDRIVIGVFPCVLKLDWQGGFLSSSSAVYLIKIDEKWTQPTKAKPEVQLTHSRSSCFCRGLF